MKLKNIIFIISILILSSCGGGGSDNANANQDSKSNKNPIVNIGEDKSISIGDTITLLATVSDSDGSIISYTWKKGSKVLGDSATLIYTPTTSGTDTLTLTVSDDDGATASDSIDITIYETKN